MKYKIRLRNRNEYVFFELRLPREREVLISTGIKVPISQWTGEQAKKTYKDHESINTNLVNQRRELEGIILKGQFEGRSMTARSIKERFEAKDLHNIFDFTEQYIKDLKNKRDGATLENYRKHLNKLKKFSGSNLHFEQITSDYLLKYEHWLFEKGLSENYASLLMRTLNQMFIAAIKKKIVENNPFDQYERPKYKAPDKPHLTAKELEKWEEFIHTTNNPVYKQTALYFLLGCYSGLRISDWYRFNDDFIRDGWVRLRPKKKSTGYVRMRISKPLARVIVMTKEIPLTIEEPTLNEKLKEIAKELKIKKHLTSHSGRHTFAVTICLNNQVSSETAAELMGITLKTFVDNYSEVTEQKIDQETRRAWAKLK